MLSRARVNGCFFAQKLGKITKRLPAGAVLCMVASVLVKGVGAIYKIPLAGALGAEGMGLYQLIFPLYAILLTLSGAVAPQALTRISANGYGWRCIIKRALTLFCLSGMFFAVLLTFFGRKIGEFQGNAQAGELYKIIAPSLVVCSVIAVLRGMIQGRGEFLPTALSQIIEQGVKAAVGLVAVYFLPGGALKKAAYATLAVLISEIVALFYLFAEFYKRFLKEDNRFPKENKLFSNGDKRILNGNKLFLKGNNRFLKGNKRLSKPKRQNSAQKNQKNIDRTLSYKTLLFYAAPLCGAMLIMPLAAFLDGFVAVNSLKLNFKNAVALYGAFSGAAETVIALPAGALGAFCSACLPRLKSSPAREKLLCFTAFASLLAAACVFLFNGLIVKLLFSNFGEYKPLVAELLRRASANVIFQSVLAATNVILLSLDGQAFSLISLTVALIFKVTLNVLLIKIPQINVFGLIISDSCFYLLALLLNLGYIIYCVHKNRARSTV